MNQTVIENHYDLQVSGIKLLDSHFGTEIHAVNTDKGKYIVKTLPLYVVNVENEGYVTEYLHKHGIKVARLLKSKTGEYAVKTAKMQFTVQEFIEGETFTVNTAPDWFMEKSAEILGRVNCQLKNYGQMPLKFGKDFFSADTASRKKSHYNNEIAKAMESGNKYTIPLFEEQIRHLDKIVKFGIVTSKLTYTNSHGDYHIGQAIVKDNDITIIDWTSACCLPVCLDVITSYVFACPACREGVVDVEGLKNYIRIYTEYFHLAEYDIKSMPYVLYFWHCVCNYSSGELSNIPESYKPTAGLVLKLLNWLYDNVEELSSSL